MAQSATPAPASGGAPNAGVAGGGAGTVSGKKGAESTNNKAPGKNPSAQKKHKKSS
jgi:hypothetical protein